MSKLKGNFKRIISMVLSLAMILSVVPMTTFAENGVIYLPQDEISEEILTSGEFYLATSSAEVQEDSDVPYLFKIGRGGVALPEAKVRLNIIDITAKYGDDYTIRVYNGSIFDTKVQSTDSSTSLLEEIIENEDSIVEENYSDGVVSGEEVDFEDAEEMYQEDVELFNDFLVEEVEGYESETVAEDSEQQDETDAEEPETSTEAVEEEQTEDVEEKSDEDAASAESDEDESVPEVEEDTQTEQTDEETTESEEDSSEEEISESTDSTPGEEAKASGSSLKSAKEIATGLKSDKTPMDGGNNSLDLYTREMLSELSMELESAYLIVEFGEGETEKYIEIIPKDNDYGDGDRLFSVSLFSASDTAVVGQKSGITVSIIDDEIQEPASVSFTESRYYPEDGYIKVTLERTGAINQVVSVSVTTEDVTAVKGRDYSQVETVVVFPYGITERTINIPIRSDYIEDNAEFKIVISDAASCNVGEIDTAYGTIVNGSVSYSLFAAAEDEEESNIMLMADATASSYFTGNAIDLSATSYSTGAHHDGYSRASGDDWHLYAKDDWNEAWAWAYWNIGAHYDYSGIELTWTKESGKPCYTETFVKTYDRADDNWDVLWSSDSERWGRDVDKFYFSFDQSNYVYINVSNDGGWAGKSPTLKIHDIKPILRPFEITLKGADPLYFLNEDGVYVKNTEMNEVLDANNTLLQNASDTGTGTVVKFSGDSFTVTSNSKYSYIKGLKIVNNSTGASKLIRDNLAVGTTSVSVKLTNDFLKDNLDYVTFSNNGSLGRKGAFSVQAVMGYYDTTVRVYKDYKGNVEPVMADDDNTISSGYYYLKNANSGLYLGQKTDAAGDLVQRSSKENCTIWYVNSGSIFTFTNYASNNTLKFPYSDGNPVFTTAGFYNSHTVESQDDGTFVIRNFNDVLDIKNQSTDEGATAIATESLNGEYTNSQKWILEEANIVTTGTYRIKNKKSGLYMRPDGGVSGAVKQSSDLTNLNWYVTKLDDGWYSLRAEDGCMLDVKSASASNWTKLITYSDNGTDAQRFKLQKNSDESYSILTKVTSGKSGLDVSNASTDSGASIIQYKLGNSDNFKWIFEKADGMAYIEDSSAITYHYHKGDKIRFVQNINADYASSYTGSRIRIVTKDNSTATSVDNKRAYDDGTNYCTILNSYSNIDVYPNYDKKDNHVVVRVAKSDLSKFDTSVGIFTSPSVESGNYQEYTVVENDDFAAGIYYELKAKAKNDGYTPVWQQIHKDTKYSQSTFYFESTDEIEENIIYLRCEKADSQKYVLTGEAYYSDVALNGGKEGTAWMPASGVYVVMGPECYGISNEDGHIGTVGVYGKNGMSVIYKTVASGITEYKTVVLSNKNSADFSGVSAYNVNIGTVKASTTDNTAPYVTAVVATNLENVESGVVSINDNITVFTVTLNNNGAQYTDTDGKIREEKVKAVDFLVYDKKTHKLKSTISGAKQVSEVNGMCVWTLSSTFTKGDESKYAASDELFVRITTDKVVGNGKGYNANGVEEELDALKQTIHAPINTGYTFVESNRQEPVTQDIDFNTNMDFVQLPLIGTMEATFNVKNISLSISALPNGGQRLAVGFIPKSAEEKEKEATADNGVNYGVKDIKEAFKGIKEFGKEMSDTGSLGMKSWGLKPIFGIYLDFGIKNVYHTEDNSTENKLVFIGGGLYLGMTGKFRVVQYFVVGWVPFYLGVDGELSAFTETGIRAINEDTATSDSILTEQNSIDDHFEFATCLQANGLVSAYVGAGLCGTLGVRGGIAFNANYIYNPTIKKAYPDYDENGLILSADIKVWVDALLFPIPIPAVNIATDKYGYFEDVASSETASLMSMKPGNGSEIAMKPRNTDISEWLPAGSNISLMSTFEEDTSTVLLENGYDRADSQLLDLGDGRIMLAFLADDPARTDANRTALMYSIYDGGTWSVPVKVQDDDTADFEPFLCDAGDKVLIVWTSRNTNGDFTTETEYLKSIDVYTTTLDKATLELGDIERLTDDEFYDSSPVGLYDDESGDMLVYYLKSEVGSDFETSVSPTTNESVIVYMLYDAAEGKWARDYYYDNEVESEEAEEILVNNWGGQRFLSSPIKDFEINDPIIIDFDAISYNGIGVYTYTIDEDNNMDTDGDRELFVQAYDFESHSTYVPVRITNDNLSDTMPQLVRNGEYTYLFWLQNSADIRYINISDLIKNGINDDGTLKADYELNCGVVFFVQSEGSNVNPTFGSYKAFVDKDDNLFVTWLQPVTDDDGSSSQEIYASALIRDDEGTSWTDGVRLTHSGLFNDEVAFVTDSDGNLLTVGNQYSMDLSRDDYSVSDVKLVATKFKAVGSLEIDEVEYSDDVPQAGSTVDVTVKVKNTGLKPAKGYTLTVREKVNGSIKDEVFSVTSENDITPSSSDLVTFEWTMPESYEGIEDLSLYVQVQEAEMDEIESYSSESIRIQPVYNITEYAVEEKADGFVITYSVENIGNVDAECDDLTTDDKVVVKFNDIYHYGKEVEPYLEAPIGGLEINEVKTFVLPLEIEDEQFEFGYTNAYIEVQDKDGNSLSDNETFMITLEYPYSIVVNGDAELSQITLDEGTSLELSAEYSPSNFYVNADINYYIEDASVAYMEDGKLVANSAGETELTVMIVPYGGYKTLKVIVNEKSSSPSRPSGNGGTTKYTVTINTNGGNEIGSLRINRNSVIGEIETPVKEGFMFDGWYLDENLTEKADLNAKVTSNITLYAKWVEESKQEDESKKWMNPFVDVNSDDWFYENVKYANQNGLFSGTTETTFAPNEDLTRAMLVTVLYRAEGNPDITEETKFVDVASNAYYADAVAWAESKGIVMGVSETEFAPDNKITREQIATIMYRYAIYKGTEAVTLEENLTFTDADSISEYAISAMNWIVGQGIIKGYEDGTVRPQNNATRAEAAAVLQRFLEKIEAMMKVEE